MLKMKKPKSMFKPLYRYVHKDNWIKKQPLNYQQIRRAYLKSNFITGLYPRAVSLESLYSDFYDKNYGKWTYRHQPVILKHWIDL